MLPCTRVPPSLLPVSFQKPQPQPQPQTTKHYSISPLDNDSFEHDVCSDDNDDSISDTKRRRVFSYTSLASTALWSGHTSSVKAAASETATTSTVTTLDCLSDLPRFDSTTTVRLYLCRHGETEYNRLKIVQGSRVDAPLNDRGRYQATLLGQALSRADVPPTFFYHSPLLRAQQTAQLAADASSSAAASSGLIVPTPSLPWLLSSLSSSQPRLRRLDSLTEVDFGAVAEGTPVANNRAQLVALYTSWAMGNLEARMSAGTGESGTEVRGWWLLVLFQRAFRAMHAHVRVVCVSWDVWTYRCHCCISGPPNSPRRIHTFLLVCACAHVLSHASLPQTQILSRIGRAVETMVETAAFDTSSGCLAAVAHSAYLRLLLGSVTGFASFSATSLQANCCINVLDVARPTNMQRRAKNGASSVPVNPGLTRGKVVRINETRHLSTLPMRQSALSSTIVS